MRPYRGLTKEGKLIYGYHLAVGPESSVSHYILPHEKAVWTSKTLSLNKDEDFITGFVEVIPETVGQFTGLNDKSGTEVYGGDKLKDSIDGDIGVVYWKESAAGFYVKWGDGSDMSLNYGVATCKCEIIGNIHRTELLEQDNA